MSVRFSKKFSKQFDKAPEQVREAFERRLELFLEDPRHPLLHTHQLQGTLAGHWSINITGDWRAIFRELGNGIICFDMIGTHSDLYE